VVPYIWGLSRDIFIAIGEINPNRIHAGPNKSRIEKNEAKYKLGEINNRLFKIYECKIAVVAIRADMEKSTFDKNMTPYPLSASFPLNQDPKLYAPSIIPIKLVHTTIEVPI